MCTPSNTVVRTRLELAVILTPEQFDLVKEALKQRKPAEMPAVPGVAAFSGRQVQIKMVDIRYVVTGLRTNAHLAGELAPITRPVECGPVLDMLPRLRSDGRTIEVNLLSALREFLGYDMEGVEETKEGHWQSFASASATVSGASTHHSYDSRGRPDAHALRGHNPGSGEGPG